jgi:hypothetical protein
VECVGSGTEEAAGVVAGAFVEEGGEAACAAGAVAVLVNVGEDVSFSLGRQAVLGDRCARAPRGDWKSALLAELAPEG